MKQATTIQVRTGPIANWERETAISFLRHHGLPITEATIADEVETLRGEDAAEAYADQN